MPEIAGFFRHADAGYDLARKCADEQGVKFRCRDQPMPRTAHSKLFIGCLTVVLAMVLLVGVSIGVLRYRDNARFARVEEHLASNSALLADAVRSVIAASPTGKTLPASVLPAALAAPDVKFATCDESHVSLIVQTSPDTQSGYRVWIGDQPSDYSDLATSLPNVFRFSYSNDLPESPTNRSPQRWRRD